MPLWHVLPPVQALPHVPQWLLFVEVFTHCPPQSCCPDGQTQAPDEQLEPLGQDVPHVPQFCCVPSGCWFGHRHCPPLHVEPPPQAVLHVPQCAFEVDVLTHPAAPQSCCPLGQLHSAPEHDVPLGQAWLQPPQCELSVLMLRHTPPHSTCPLGQTQLPFEQILPPVHALPHEPQFDDVSSGVSQPLAAVQSPRPAWQV